MPNLLHLPKGCRFCTRCECATERCFAEMPELYETAEGHRVRCFLSENEENREQKAEKLQAENIQAEEAAADAEADITSFPDEDLASVSAQAETVTDTETPEGEKVGEAVLTSSASAGAFSASAKLNREQVRSRNEASLLEIINNTEISEDMKADAIASMNQLTDRAEKELDAEILLDAKGFKDSVVSINDDSVDVIIGAASITEEQRAQIEDIVTRKTERNVSDIVITTME